MENKVYNYKRFKPKYYDFAKFVGPKVGEKAVDFEVYTLDGEKIRLSDYFGKPTVLETGSITCAVYVGKIKTMCQIAEEWNKFANFLVLYVREAHPGGKIGPHKNLDAKLYQAKRLQKERGEDIRTILVDDLKGTAHKTYGEFPNSIYIFDEAGYVAYRSKWNNTKEVEGVLSALKEGREVPVAKNRRFEPPPRMSLFAFAEGGWLAFWDFIIAFPRLIFARLFQR